MIIPVPAQNSCLREYVSKRNGTYILPNLESSFDNCFHQLFGSINSLSKGDALVMYSVTMLPKDPKLKNILDTCISEEIMLAFVLENFTALIDYSKLIDELNVHQLAALELNEQKWNEMVNTYY